MIVGAKPLTRPLAPSLAYVCLSAWDTLLYEKSPLSYLVFITVTGIKAAPVKDLPMMPKEMAWIAVGSVG